MHKSPPSRHLHATRGATRQRQFAHDDTMPTAWTTDEGTQRGARVVGRELKKSYGSDQTQYG